MAFRWMGCTTAFGDVAGNRRVRSPARRHAPGARHATASSKAHELWKQEPVPLGYRPLDEADLPQEIMQHEEGRALVGLDRHAAPAAALGKGDAAGLGNEHAWVLLADVVALEVDEKAKPSASQISKQRKHRFVQQPAFDPYPEDPVLIED